MNIEDLKVLEIASVLAGPSVGSFFAELGAKVTKVENPTLGGDVTRSWKLPNEDPDRKVSAYYAAANTNKTVIYLNFDEPDDKASLHLQIAQCDIIIVNFKPGDAEKFELGYRQCLNLNPKLIYAEITGYGSKIKRSAFDMILQAETGYLSMNGSKNAMAKLPVAFIDLFAAHQLKEGVLVALLNGNQPAKVSVSLYDAAIASLANQATNQLMNDHTPKRLGTLHPNIAPYGEILECSDGAQLVLAVGNNKQFRGLCSILGLNPNEKYKSNSKRLENRTALQADLQSAALQITSTDFCEACDKLQVPVGRILSLKEVFDSSEAQRLVIEEEYDQERVRKVKTAVFTISS